MLKFLDEEQTNVKEYKGISCTEATRDGHKVLLNSSPLNVTEAEACGFKRDSIGHLYLPVNSYKDFVLVKKDKQKNVAIGYFIVNGKKVYVYTWASGMAEVPIFVRISKDEYEKYDPEKYHSDWRGRKALCSGYFGDEYFSEQDLESCTE